MGFYIGINGCSLREEQYLTDLKRLPLSSLMIETDAPYCAIRPTHASAPLLSTLSTSPAHSHLKELFNPLDKKKEKYEAGKAVKGRNEPCSIGNVAWVVGQVFGVSMEEVAEVTRRNTLTLFKGMREEDGVWPEDVEGGSGEQ
jgi:TatD DNase family protein